MAAKFPTCWRIICAAFSLIGWEILLVADLSEIEAGALYMDGILQEILPPSTRRLYWRVEDDLTLVRMNTQQVQYKRR